MSDVDLSHSTCSASSADRFLGLAEADLIGAKIPGKLTGLGDTASTAMEREIK